MIKFLCNCCYPDEKEEETSFFYTKTAKNLPVSVDPTLNTSSLILNKSSCLASELMPKCNEAPVTQIL
ncbi:hypothetical protein NPIL_497891, partial [Nephila pilipes]